MVLGSSPQAGINLGDVSPCCVGKCLVQVSNIPHLDSKRGLECTGLGGISLCSKRCVQRLDDRVGIPGRCIADPVVTEPIPVDEQLDFVVVGDLRCSNVGKDWYRIHAGPPGIQVVGKLLLFPHKQDISDLSICQGRCI